MKINGGHTKINVKSTIKSELKIYIRQQYRLKTR